MSSTQGNDSVVYVTLLEAVEEVGGSTGDLRTAVRQQRIKGIKENPENKRSRWLVAIEDVKSLYGIESSESTGTLPRIADEDGSPAIDTEADTDDTPTSDEAPITETSDPGVPSIEDDESIPEPAPLEVVPDMADHQLSHIPSDQRDGGPSPMEGTVVGKGAELIERLTESIDRFSENVPVAPFDYQALLDKYVAAVEDRAEAEVRAATLQRRIDDLRDQTASMTERLEQAQSQNRQLLAELEIARAEFDVALKNGPDDDTRPLWKRRNRQ